MPLPKYNCDYCERSFNDSILNRKKHKESKTHQMAVRLHYDSYRGAQELLAEQARRPPCPNILKHGHCNFGVNCQFSHLAEQLTQGALSFNRNLPPSLNPPPEGGYNEYEINLAQWG